MLKTEWWTMLEGRQYLGMPHIRIEVIPKPATEKEPTPKWILSLN